MLRGFKALKCMFLTIEGRPPMSGNAYGGFPGDWNEETFKEYSRDFADRYWKQFKLTAKEAAKEQKWEKTAQGIYICVYIYLNPFSANNNIMQERIDNKRFAIREPRIPFFVNKITKALTGIVYEKEVQIVAMQVFKEYDSDQRIEIFIGIPKDWEGIENDLQKAE